MTSLSLTFTNDDAYPITEDTLISALTAALEAAGADGPAGVSVVMISSDQM